MPLEREDLTRLGKHVPEAVPHAVVRMGLRTANNVQIVLDDKGELNVIVDGKKRLTIEQCERVVMDDPMRGIAAVRG
jgi:citrate lyase gamma subunit